MRESVSIHSFPTRRDGATSHVAGTTVVDDGVAAIGTEACGAFFVAGTGNSHAAAIDSIKRHDWGGSRPGSPPATTVSRLCSGTGTSSLCQFAGPGTGPRDVFFRDDFMEPHCVHPFRCV